MAKEEIQLGLVHCGLGQKRRSTLGGVVEMLILRRLIRGEAESLGEELLHVL